MAPREGCPLRSGDWCSRLSWPGTPVTSFRWGRVVTITVSPGGAASPARRDAPRRSSGIPSVRTTAPGFRRVGTPAYDGDIPHGRVRVLPGRGIRRRRGQQSRPPTRHLSPAAQKCPRTRRMSPAAAPECGVFMPRPKTPVRREGFDCRYSPPRQGVTRLLAVTRMAPVIYCTRVGCHWRRVGCTPGRWDLRAVRTTPGQ